MKLHPIFLLTLAVLSTACSPAPRQSEQPAVASASDSTHVPTPVGQVAPGTIAPGTIAPSSAEPIATISIPDPGTTLIATDWVLVSLGERANPLGAGNRAVTLRIDISPNAVAAGFAGCNRYTGSYTVRRDSITFGPVGATKMACAQGMDVEQAYLSTLSKVVKYAVEDSTLTLFGASGALATYRDRPGQ